MGKAEGRVEKYLDKHVRDLGGFTRKYTSPGRRGVPDRIVFLSGVHFVETKTEDGYLSKLQVNEIRRMREAGADVAVLASREDVDTWLKHIV